LITQLSVLKTQCQLTDSLIIKTPLQSEIGTREHRFLVKFSLTKSGNQNVWTSTNIWPVHANLVFSSLTTNFSQFLNRELQIGTKSTKLKISPNGLKELQILEDYRPYVATAIDPYTGVWFLK